MIEQALPTDPTDLRVAAFGTVWWDDIYTAAHVLFDAGATVAVVDLASTVGEDDGEPSDDHQPGRFNVIDRIDDLTPAESWAYDGIGPIRKRLDAVLGGPPNTVVLGDVPGLPVGTTAALDIVDLAPEVVLLGANRPRLDESVRTLLYRRPWKTCAAVAMGRLRASGVDPGYEERVLAADLLVAGGFGHHITLDGLDRLARRRRRDVDALAGRAWLPNAGTEVVYGCLVADVNDVVKARKRGVLKDWGTKLVDLTGGGVEAVLVPMDSGEGEFDAVGPRRRPDAIRLGVLSDAFDVDSPYESVAELSCRSGRLFMDSFRGVRDKLGKEFEVRPGSRWVVETHWHDGTTGIRVRRVDAHLDITQIKLARGPCFGWCPFYELTLRKDGSAHWLGEGFVEPMGHQRAKVTPADFERVARAVIDEGFDDWPRHLGRFSMTDASSTAISVARGRAHRTVVQGDPFQPPGFARLAAEADRVARRLGWARPNSSSWPTAGGPG